ncbi:MAG: 3-hydroxybutyryl-CoA dehydrogenase [Candidatus Eremiobacter antarcticus]|nr:3-hydroxybutyryl-CoA dehydrogenase [Candidatus Eremiobacteraeota bacterium]PZR60809.1 MAG: 3-hydroxybutyryl-CoA dehydrogenase [Candidatus Eremiobacter sp. RRmetagenome_bin22]
MRVLVVGAGQMGSGIAQVCAVAGNEVQLNDVTANALAHGCAAIRRNLERSVEKGKISAADSERSFQRITELPSIEGSLQADLAIEAVSESLDLKTRVLQALDAALPPAAILASNTSSLSITVLGAVTKRADRVIGMHFMNPVPLMRLVELVRGIATSQATFAFAKQFAEALGKVAVEINDFPGFASNRILMPMLNEAMFANMEGVGSAEAIDTIMKLGMNHPMGPLELADFIGLDTCLAIMQVLYDGFNDPKYRPCPLLKKMVAAGYLGKKSGRGFYQYS